MKDNKITIKAEAAGYDGEVSIHIYNGDVLLDSITVDGYHTDSITFDIDELNNEESFKYKYIIDNPEQPSYNIIEPEETVGPLDIGNILVVDGKLVKITEIGYIETLFRVGQRLNEYMYDIFINEFKGFSNATQFIEGRYEGYYTEHNKRLDNERTI